MKKNIPRIFLPTLIHPTPTFGVLEKHTKIPFFTLVAINAGIKKSILPQHLVALSKYTKTPPSVIDKQYKKFRFNKLKYQII